jgi:hypothetical protein
MRLQEKQANVQTLVCNFISFLKKKLKLTYVLMFLFD